MVDPSVMFTNVPVGEFLQQIGDLKIDDRVEWHGGKVTVKYLQKCADGRLLAYYDYDGGGEGCAVIHPNGRFRL